MPTRTKTSETHPLQIAEIRVGDAGDSAIGLTVCPGKKQPKSTSGNWQRDLKTDLLAVKNWGAIAVVTLMPWDELKGVKSEGIGDACESLGMEWYHLPIKDVDVPDERFERHWIYAGLRLRFHLRSGRRVLIHCRGGLGRTGTIAGRLLAEMGWEPQRAISEVRRVRSGAIETYAQEKHVLKASKPAYDDPYVERMLGCLFGGAVGDAFGYPIEFSSMKDIIGSFGPSGLRHPEFADGKLIVSDDTQMTLFTIEGLLHGMEARGDWVDDDLIHSVFDAYLDWSHTQGQTAPSRLGGKLAKSKSMHHRRAPGETSLAALASRHAGTVDRPMNTSKGCGAAMRTAPVGFLQSQTRNAAQRLGEALGALTHGHIDGWLPAGAVAGMVSLLMEGVSLKSAAKQVVDHLETFPSSDVARKQRTNPLLKLALNLATRNRTRPRESIRALGQGWTGDEALAIALYCAMTGGSFVDVVRRAANHDGDSDSTASIAGQLYGAWKGVFTVPHGWIRRLDVLDEILLLAERWTLRVRGTAPPTEDASARESMRVLREYVLNVLRMVQVLHVRGYQRLRISPGLSPSGCYFRVFVTPANNIYSDNGALVVEHLEGTALYTTGRLNCYFGWNDAQDDSPLELADKFLDRFPDIAEAGRGRDWEYSGWFNEMLGFAEADRFPMADFDPWYEPYPGTMHVSGYRDGEPRLPAPPVGTGPRSEESGTRLYRGPATDDEEEWDPESIYDNDADDDGDDFEVDEVIEDSGEPHTPQPLNSFDISDEAQRILALCAFHAHGLGHLIPFTQLLWDRLREPKGERAELFAQLAGIEAKGKLALRKLLRAFYDEATEARMMALDARGPIPEVSGFDDVAAWLVRLAEYSGAADSALTVVARKYSMVLNGEDPGSSGNPPKTAVVIVGPWEPKM